MVFGLTGERRRERSWREHGVSYLTDDLTNIWSRKYPEVKLQENIDSEIMEVLLQEARDSYDEEIVVELQSTNSEEMETNIDRIGAWLKQWKENNAT